MKLNNSRRDILDRINYRDAFNFRSAVRTAGAFALRPPEGLNRKGDTSTRNALARIIGEGEAVLKHSLLSLGAELPSNWGKFQLVHEVDGGMSWFGWRNVDEKIFEMAARRSGWMKACAQLMTERPGFFQSMVRSIIKLSRRGMNSPRNEGSWAVVNFLTGKTIDRWGTPGHAFRVISAGIRRAKEILVPFEISRVPWIVVAKELGNLRGPKRAHKLGRKLALATLNHVLRIKIEDISRFRGFRLNNWLAMSPEKRELRRLQMQEAVTIPFGNLPELDMTVEDGVRFFRFSERKMKGHDLIEGYVVDGDRRVSLRKAILVISPSRRTYHVSVTLDMLLGSTELILADTGFYRIGETLYSPIAPAAGKKLTGLEGPEYWYRHIVRCATTAWRKQDSVGEVSLLKDRSVLVFLRDSYDAGNCVPGTKSFLARMGWSNRLFVPAQWLFCSSETRAVAAAMVAVRRHCMEVGRE